MIMFYLVKPRGDLLHCLLSAPDLSFTISTIRVKNSNFLELHDSHLKNTVNNETSILVVSQPLFVKQPLWSHGKGTFDK